MKAAEYLKLSAKSKVKRKYGNIRTTYNNRSYDSKAEAEWAQRLDMLVLEKAIRFWLPQQPKFYLTNQEKPQTYTADFLIVKNDGSFIVADCKGFDTTEGRLKRSIVKDRYQIDVLITFNDVLNAIYKEGQES